MQSRPPLVRIADVAQLVEQLFRKQQVARSIRVVGSIFFSSLLVFGY